MTHPLEAYFQRTEGESRQTLSKRAGISEMHLSRLIRGKGEISTKTLRAVSQATGGVVSVAELAAAFERSAAANRRTPKPARQRKEPTAA